MQVLDRGTLVAAPERTCVGCRRRRPKHELVRLARTGGDVRLDLSRRLPGRGAYVCPDPACVASASRRGARSVRHTLRGGSELQVREVLDALASRLAGGTEERSKEQPE